MKKISLARLTAINWKEALKKNRYPIISLIIGIAYCSVSFLAISFVVANIRNAFAVDEQFVKSQIVTFDLSSYEMLKKWFGN